MYKLYEIHFRHTISQADAGFVSIDVKENAFIANLGLGSQANKAADIRISGPTWRSGSFCCCCCCWCHGLCYDYDLRFGFSFSRVTERTKEARISQPYPTDWYSLFRASGPNRPFSFFFFFSSFFLFFGKNLFYFFLLLFFFFFFFLNMCCHWPMTCEWIIDGRKTRSEWIIIRHFWDTIMIISLILNWVEKVWFQTCLKSCTPTYREMILDPFNPTNQANCVYCTWREICHLHIGSWNQTSSWLST